MLNLKSFSSLYYNLIIDVRKSRDNFWHKLKLPTEPHDLVWLLAAFFKTAIQHVSTTYCNYIDMNSTKKNWYLWGMWFCYNLFNYPTKMLVCRRRTQFKFKLQAYWAWKAKADMYLLSHTAFHTLLSMNLTSHLLIFDSNNLFYKLTLWEKRTFYVWLARCLINFQLFWFYLFTTEISDLMQLRFLELSFTYF